MPRQTVRDFGTCLNLNGTSQYVLLKTSAILAGQTNATVIIWIRTNRVPPNDSTTPAIYCERAGSGNDIFKLEITAAGRLRFTYRDDAGTLNQITDATKAIVNDGRWHMVSLVKAGTAVSMYVDAAADTAGTLTATNTLTDAGIHATIGIDFADSSSFFYNYVDEAWLFIRALAAGEITDLYYTGITANSGINSVGHYKMDEGSGTTTIDTTGTQTAATLIGTPTWSTDVVMKSRQIAS